MIESTKEIIEKMVLHGTLAFFGGAAAYLANTKYPKVIEIIVHGFIGSFVGVVFGLIATCITGSQYIHFGLAGVGGWVGKEGMVWLFEVIREGLKKKIK